MRPLTIALLLGFSILPHATHCATHQVRFETTMGNIVIELDSIKAPITVANFLKYVNSGFYNSTIFHRVIPGFMIQGGGHTANMTLKATNADIRNEAFNGLKNMRGTIAMARETAPHTANSQFFINVVDNNRLDYKDSSSATNWGYCVFGKVVTGMNLADSISKVATKTVGSYANVPVVPILVNKATDIVVVSLAPKIRKTQNAQILAKRNLGHFSVQGKIQR